MVDDFEGYTMASNKLTAKQVDKAKTGVLEDGAGLRFVVSKTGGRKWVLRYTYNKKRRDMGLGVYPDISLADARVAATAARNLAKAGTDPVEDRKKAKKQEAQKLTIPTFAECAVTYIGMRESEWSNAKHKYQWTATINNYVNPTIGTTLVNEITLDHVLKILTPIWTTKTETAKRVRMRIENILDWAKVKGYRSGENPALLKGNLDHLLPKASKVQVIEHHPAMPYKQLPAFVSELKTTRSSISAKALLLTILSATRTSETLNATWNEFDFDQNIWTIPASRTKTKQEHRIPLTDEMINLLESAPRLNKFVFAGKIRNKPLSNLAMLMLLRKMGYGEFTVHGFRSTFRDWAADTTTFQRELAEAALAHKLENKVEAAYQRSDMLEKRRALMKSWNQYALSTSSGNKVVTGNFQKT
jgi:integrase